MIIGFDAKRAFYNHSGLGNYSRTTIKLLSEYYPDNRYFLYSPQLKNAVDLRLRENTEIHTPDTFFAKIFPKYWRFFAVSGQAKREHVQLFHGLSNELPAWIQHTGMVSVVTVHDLIFMRYPEFYRGHDRSIYKSKFSSACHRATHIIAISEQTKADIIQFLDIDEKKITVVYQSCDERFFQVESDNRKKEVLQKYNLPNKYLFSVGTIEERKNVLSLVKAVHNYSIDIPVVIVGKPTEYADVVKNYILRNSVKNVFFLENVPPEDLPALYQQAEIFVYPSIFEGFGLPILEALNSKVPVITSKGGCFSEAGGKSTLYIDPKNEGEIAETIKNVLTNNTLRQNMIIDGYLHAQQFRQEKVAQNLMRLYSKLLQK
jgi:glycosyltransferase involved in cell wall biosynthesis